jgi:hypothetical protein
MTFEEGLRFKQVFKASKIVFDGLEYDILVVPNHRDDFKRYCDNYPRGGFSDESARDYCLDNKFQLMALYNDVAIIQYKKIG